MWRLKKNIMGYFGRLLLIFLKTKKQVPLFFLLFAKKGKIVFGDTT